MGGFRIVREEEEEEEGSLRLAWLLGLNIPARNEPSEENSAAPIYCRISSCTQDTCHGLYCFFFLKTHNDFRNGDSPSGGSVAHWILKYLRKCQIKPSAMGAQARVAKVTYLISGERGQQVHPILVRVCDRGRTEEPVLAPGSGF